MTTGTAQRDLVQSTQELSPDRRLQGIDVLRGLAVLLVVLHHIHLRFQINRFEVANLLPAALGKVLFWSGHYSVIAFFVISGFLITSLSLRRWQSLDRISLPLFYRLRAARILPCLLLLLAVLSVLHLLAATDFTIKPERASLGRTLVAVLTFHFNWLEGHRGYLGGANWDVLWSLSVEEAFYVLFPLACALLRRERWLLIGLLALIVVGPFNRVMLRGQQPWEDYAYLSCMDAIAFGCIAAWIAVRASISQAGARGALIAGVAAVMLVVVFRKQTFDLGLTNVGLNVTILAMGMALVLLALAKGLGNAALSRGTGLLQLAGRCSYEIYLTHMFVVLGLMHPFKAMFGTAPPGRTAYAVTYAVMVALSVVLGYAIARLFSEPLNRALRDKFATVPSPSLESAPG